MEKHIDHRTGKPKIILDLCGGTGSWSRPYKEAGYDVRLITLPEHDVLTYEPPEGVYGVLAAPPCTEFSVAKTTAPRDLAKGTETIKACIEIIWQCQAESGIQFWALENPVGLLRKFLGRPEFTFFQWEYGAEFVKRTDLWGYFNSPKKTVLKRPEGLTKQFPCGSFNSATWSAPKCPTEYIGRGLTKADIRAITPPGFAQAFFRANR